MDVSERALVIHNLLLETYGYPEWRSPLPPLDELVSTILSQNTNDINRDRAFQTLKARFPTWEEARDAPPADVIDAIRSAGLANQKGPRIQAILKAITDQCGSLDLGFMREWDPEQAWSWLVRFKGVGPKTAAIVLLFSLDMPAFPVDTHIHRVTGRLGIRPQRMNADQAHVYLAKVLPPESYYAAHLNLIRLGREICQARRPNCPACPVKAFCDYFAVNFSGEK